MMRGLLVNRLSFEEMHANLTLNVQMKGQTNTNSWIGYHGIDNLPLNFYQVQIPVQDIQ